MEGLSGKAQTYIRMGKADEAKKLLLQVIAANPRRAMTWRWRASCSCSPATLPARADLLERSESVQPSSHAELLLAITYMKQKQPEKAKQLLDHAMKRSPKNTDIFRAVAEYYREAHDYKAAIAILQKAPGKSRCDVRAGFTYELGGMKKESADAYEKAAAMAPNRVKCNLRPPRRSCESAIWTRRARYLARGEQLDATYYRLHAIRGDLAKIGAGQ